MKPSKIATLPTAALLVAIPLLLFLLTGCPKRADVAKVGTEATASEAGGEATPGTSTSRPTASPPGSSYSSSVRSKEESVTPPASVQEAPAKGAPAAGPTGMTGPSAKESALKDIFFDFDRSNIRDDAKPNLGENVEWLKANPTAQIALEGHCDERGSAEYNLGLGERRAKATRDYLVASGIDAKRMKIISYGKERPFVLGHDESAWKWNRRTHFVVGER